MMISQLKYKISIGGMIISIESEIPLAASSNMQKFIASGSNSDIELKVRFVDVLMPFPENFCGEDLLFDYYADESYCYAVTKPGTLGPLSVSQFAKDYSQNMLFVNEKEHPNIVRSVDKVLHLFPIRQFLAKRNAMILHASAIKIGQKGILFSAPSGTGKSTQAQLWKKHEDSKMICNDRTLIRKNDDIYDIYGYPIDGNTPICTNAQVKLGAIVVLRQGLENHIQRLSVAKSLKFLLEQTMIDAWDTDELEMIMTLWLDILKKYPVYLYSCTPNQESVAYLKKQLEEDGVI